MLKVCQFALLSLCLVGLSPVASAVFKNNKFSFAVSSGDGISDITPYRIAGLYDFGPVLCKSCMFQGHLLGEVSAAFWHGNQGDFVHSNEKLTLVTTGPLLRWQLVRTGFANIRPFFEMGIGLSWLSKREIGGRRISTHFQFEDRIGLGLRFGKGQPYELNYRLFHYSNASIKRPNSGVNIQMLTFAYWFS